MIEANKTYPIKVVTEKHKVYQAEAKLMIGSLAGIRWKAECGSPCFVGIEADQLEKLLKEESMLFLEFEKDLKY